ncbi:hypothetical protein TNCV_2226401 [Trichonephila clavipes]|nr:hypothetical protein TNCV_2226401 [Trichonephila clavipes]
MCIRVVRPFLKSRENVSDNPRSGRLTTSISDENIEKVMKLSSKDHQLTGRTIADELQINRDSMRQIVMQNLEMRKSCYRY